MIKRLCSQLVLRSSLISSTPYFDHYEIGRAYHFRRLSSASLMSSGRLASLNFAASGAQIVCLNPPPLLLVNH